MDDQDYCPNIGDEAIDKLDVAFKSGDWGGAESVLDGAVTSLLGVRNDLLTGVLMYARLGLSDTACYQRAVAQLVESLELQECSLTATKVRYVLFDDNNK